MIYLPFPNKKYKIILCDPPWDFDRGVYQDNDRKDRIIDDKYPTMDKKDIIKLPIINISDKDAALFLWVTDSHLKEGTELIEYWGFTYRTIAFIWKKITKNGKTCANVGAWTMKNCEVCLLGIKGNMLQYKKKNNVFQLIEAVRTKHSKKPEQARRKIVELFGDLPRIELFARPPKDLLFEDESYKGWDLWGDEC